MMTVSNREKSIQYSLSNVIHENQTSSDVVRFTYTPELPVIACSSKKDAEHIQKEVNTFVNKIINDLVK